jgi:hypothetical protein
MRYGPEGASNEKIDIIRYRHHFSPMFHARNEIGGQGTPKALKIKIF